MVFTNIMLRIRVVYVCGACALGLLGYTCFILSHTHTSGEFLGATARLFYIFFSMYFLLFCFAYYGFLVISFLSRSGLLFWFKCISYMLCVRFFSIISLLLLLLNCFTRNWTSLFCFIFYFIFCFASIWFLYCGGNLFNAEHNVIRVVIEKTAQQHTDLILCIFKFYNNEIMLILEAIFFYTFCVSVCRISSNYLCIWHFALTR